MAGIEIARVLADGREYKHPRGELRLTRGSERVRFEIKTPPGRKAPVRWRYMMVGVDETWRDPAVNARFMIRLLNGKRQIIADIAHTLNGESPGWEYPPERSAMQRVNLELPVPDQAQEAHLFLASTPPGGGNCVGLLLMDQVRAILRKPGRAPRIYAFDLLGEDIMRPDGVPDNWYREGSDPKLAQIWPPQGVDPHPILALVDDDPLNYALWTVRPPNIGSDPVILVEHGETLSVEFRIAHTLGRGDDDSLEYPFPEPGNFELIVAAVHPDGRFTGERATLRLRIRPPWTQEPALWIGLCSLLALGIVWLSRLAVQRKIAASLVELERQRALEAERTRIARDIHDDLGASLTQIALLTELAQAETVDGRTDPEQLHAIAARAHAATRRLREIVWAIDAANDSLENLVGYLCQFADDYLKLAGLRFRMDAPESLPEITLPSAIRHHFFLAAREALHNAVKHSHATEVQLHMRVNAGHFILGIHDNGIGYHPPSNAGGAPTDSAGHGTENMRSRMAQIGGTYRCESSPEKGTTVTLTLPIPTSL